MNKGVQLKLEINENKFRKFSKNSENIPKVIKRVLLIIGVEGETLTKRKTPVDTGRLKSSVTNEVKGDTVKIGSNVSYAPFILGAVGSYVIKPKREKYLHMVIKGNFVMAKRARHPGGRKILREVAEKLDEELIPKIVHKVLKYYGIVEGG